MKNLFKLLSMLLLLSLTACASSSGTKIDQNSLIDFKTGLTTKSDVIQKLGTPQSTSTTSDGTIVLSYFSTQTNVNGATFVPIVGLFAGGAKGESSMTTFIFDKNEVLKSFSNTNSNHQYNMGAGTSQN